MPLTNTLTFLSCSPVCADIWLFDSPIRVRLMELSSIDDKRLVFQLGVVAL